MLTIVEYRHSLS
jgi:DNA replicative helicase MCM subunit Mcm2 (Cdc46/Mcm family)